MSENTEDERRDDAYRALLDAGFPRAYLPSEELRQRPVTSAMLRDVPLYDDDTYGVKLGEEIPSESQVDLFYRSCKKGFTGVGVFAAIRHPFPARYAAFAYAAERVMRGRLDPTRTAWRMIEYGFKDSWLDNDKSTIYQPDLLIVDAMYRDCSVQRIEKIRSYVELNAKTTIVIAAGLSPVEAAYKRLNIEYGRVLFFL